MAKKDTFRERNPQGVGGKSGYRGWKKPKDYPKVEPSVSTTISSVGTSAGKVATKASRTAKRQQVRKALKTVRRAYRAKTPDVSSLDPHQDRVLDKILDVGRRKGASPRENLSAVETGLVESSLRNLNYGDADSTGWRQERSSIYGTGPTGPQNVKASARRFYDELRTQGAGAATPGQAAQAAQGSAFPERYDQEEPKARSILREYRRKASRPPTKGVKQAQKTLRKAGVKARPRAATPKKLPGPWSGAQRAALRVIPKNFHPDAKGDKRTPAENASVGGSSTSDHLTTDTASYAADLPADDALARRIASRLGMASHTGTQEITKNGYRYQLIWQDEGHYDHIHLGAEWTGAPSSMPSGSSGGPLSASGGTSAGGTPVRKKKTVERGKTKKQKLSRVQSAYSDSSSDVEPDLKELAERYGAPVV